MSASPLPSDSPDRSADQERAHDIAQLQQFGYTQELSRELNAFSNFAISFSIICILAGCITSFHLGFCSVGGASVGLGWPMVALFALAVAATMGQVASAFPTAGGLYHWAAILGGRGWGWTTAWLNLAGLVTVLAAINVGTYRFALGTLGPALGFDPAWLSPAQDYWGQVLGLLVITGTQALINHLGIRLTARLTDFSGYWILLIAALLVIAFLCGIRTFEPGRLFRFTNFSGDAGGGVWPATNDLFKLFALGLLLPAYTITGFDASAHTAEETVGADRNVPRGIVRSVLVSGLAGWILLMAAVLAMPDLAQAAAKGEQAFAWTLFQAVPYPVAMALTVSVVLAQYLCGLATVTSASRMTFAFARDGGIPGTRWLRLVSPTRRTPHVAIWACAIASVLFTLWSPVYSTITAVCTSLLYLSYVVPTILGVIAYRRTWTEMGPWSLGPWYPPLGVLCIVWCLALLVIGVQPPNERALGVLGGLCLLLGTIWFGWSRSRFPGPPQALLDHARTRIVARPKRQRRPIRLRKPRLPRRLPRIKRRRTHR